MLKHSPPPEISLPANKHRSLWTRILDVILRTLRRYAPPIHYVGYILTAVALFVYARLIALTIRLKTAGEPRWPNVPESVVVALWHRDAPSLIAAFASKRPRQKVGIMVARDPRGDSLALLCQMLGLEVVRGDNEERGWEALEELAQFIEDGGSVLITADGMGPARVAKVGTVALASATGAPMIALGAACRPAIVQRGKWDVARNPVPFGHVSVFTGFDKSVPRIHDSDSLEKERAWLQSAIEGASSAAEEILQINRM